MPARHSIKARKTVLLHTAKPSRQIGPWRSVDLGPLISADPKCQVLGILPSRYQNRSRQGRDREWGRVACLREYTAPAQEKPFWGRDRSGWYLLLGVPGLTKMGWESMCGQGGRSGGSASPVCAALNRPPLTSPQWVYLAGQVPLTDWDGVLALICVLENDH